MNGSDPTDSVPPSTGGDGPVEDVPVGPEPIGEGWEEYFPDFDYHLPPPSDEYGERYTFEDGTWNLWVLATDPSSFPGQDSGPRSEVRVRNEYSSGKRQFQDDFMVEEGAERVGIWQLFKRPYPWMIRIYDGEYRQFGDGSSFGAVPYGQWQRFYAIHDADAETLEIYIDGQLVVNENIGGTETDYYNKFGVYGREGMGAENEISWRNVHYFLQD